jgi:nucleotide-binding universal stress UspA family protein
MTAQETIVTATDLSPASRHACERAAHLARDSGAALAVVHSLAGTALEDLCRWIGTDAQTQDAVRGDAMARLHAIATDLSQRHGIQVTEHFSTGHPVKEITSFADKVDADLLVTGTRGAGFFRGVIVGSTAERLANRSERPVLMVKQSVHEAYRRVLVPVDFSMWSAEAVVLAQRIAPSATLVLMHAVEVPFERRMRTVGVADTTIAHYRDSARWEARQQLQQLAAQTGLTTGKVRLSTPDGADAWMLIAQEEQEHDCDLIVIGRQGRHTLDELLLGSTTRMVLSECAVDVLVSTRRSQ